VGGYPKAGGAQKEHQQAMRAVQAEQFSTSLLSAGGRKEEKENESVHGNLMYYVVWWEGKTVQKKR
jgi:hypothetical protein